MVVLKVVIRNDHSLDALTRNSIRTVQASMGLLGFRQPVSNMEQKGTVHSKTNSQTQLLSVSRNASSLILLCLLTCAFRISEEP